TRTAHAALLEREQGEALGGADAEAYADDAYPASQITINEIQGAIKANAAVSALAPKLSSKWDFIGPETLDVDRLGTPAFIKPTQWSGGATGRGGGRRWGSIRSASRRNALSTSARQVEVSGARRTRSRRTLRGSRSPRGSRPTRSAPLASHPTPQTRGE